MISEDVGLILADTVVCTCLETHAAQPGFIQAPKSLVLNSEISKFPKLPDVPGRIWLCFKKIQKDI